MNVGSFKVATISLVQNRRQFDLVDGTWWVWAVACHEADDGGAAAHSAPPS